MRTTFRQQLKCTADILTQSIIIFKITILYNRDFLGAKAPLILAHVKKNKKNKEKVSELNDIVRSAK